MRSGAAQRSPRRPAGPWPSIPAQPRDRVDQSLVDELPLRVHHPRHHVVDLVRDRDGLLVASLDDREHSGPCERDARVLRVVQLGCEDGHLVERRVERFDVAVLEQTRPIGGAATAGRSPGVRASRRSRGSRRLRRADPSCRPDRPVPSSGRSMSRRGRSGRPASARSAPPRPRARPVVPRRHELQRVREPSEDERAVPRLVVPESNERLFEQLETAWVELGGARGERRGSRWPRARTDRCDRARGRAPPPRRTSSRAANTRPSGRAPHRRRGAAHTAAPRLPDASPPGSPARARGGGSPSRTRARPSPARQRRARTRSPCLPARA